YDHSSILREVDNHHEYKQNIKRNNESYGKRAKPDDSCYGAENRKQVVTEMNGIANKIGGTLEQNGIPYPDFNVQKYGRKDLINPNGQSYLTIIDKLHNAGFSFSFNFNAEHYGGTDVKTQVQSGRWYHVTVAYPAAGGRFLIDPDGTPPWVTIHCHGTDPEGLTHILDYLGL